MIEVIPEYNIKVLEYINSKMEYISKHKEELYNYQFDNKKQIYESYNYKKAVYEDCYRETLSYLQEKLKDNIWPGGIDIADFLYKPKDFKDEIQDAIRKLPTVTGIESGSYNYNRTRVARYLVGNGNLLLEAVSNIGIKLEQLIGGIEIEDVCIRNYLVPKILDDVLIDISQELKEQEKQKEKNKVLDEEFYKKISKEYVQTMRSELLIEKDNKILLICIDDKYTYLSNKGKINSYNYVNYLDNDFSVLEYDSYEALFKNSIKYDIAEDIEDLGVYDENGDWDFYITKENIMSIKDDILSTYKDKEKQEEFIRYLNTNSDKPRKSLLEKAPTTSKEKEYER